MDTRSLEHSSSAIDQSFEPVVSPDELYRGLLPGDGAMLPSYSELTPELPTITLPRPETQRAIANVAIMPALKRDPYSQDQGKSSARTDPSTAGRSNDAPKSETPNTDKWSKDKK